MLQCFIADPGKRPALGDVYNMLVETMPLAPHVTFQAEWELPTRAMEGLDAGFIKRASRPHRIAHWRKHDILQACIGTDCSELL